MQTSALKPMLEVSLSERVLRLELNRPDRRNALNMALCQALVDEFARAEEDPNVGAVLLTGRGLSFCAGMDLKEARHVEPEALAHLHTKLFSVLERARKPIVAAIQGSAVAGGTGLAANAHVVFATHDAEFGLPEIRIGLWPVMIYQVVVQAVGARRTMEWSLTGRRVTALEAREAGLVTALDDDPLTVAEAAAMTMAEFSSFTIHEGLDFAWNSRPLNAGGAAELGRTVRTRIMSHSDFHEGVQAFTEKRKPRWNKEP